MFANLFAKSIEKIGFEDMQQICKYPQKYIIINTLPLHEQDCLIYNTLLFDKEETTINNLLQNYDLKSKHIIVYGKNNCDESADKKYKQIQGLGFQYVFLYSGGLFEWLLLQDIYGREEFPTTNYTLDILKYKPTKQLYMNLLEN